jgi:hypothetical protein
MQFSKLRALIVTYIVTHGRKNEFFRILSFLFVKPAYEHFAEILNLPISEMHLNGRPEREMPPLKYFWKFMFGYSKHDIQSWKGILPSYSELLSADWHEYYEMAIQEVNKQIAKAAIAMIESETEVKKSEATEIFYKAASLAKLFGFPLLFKTEEVVENKYYAHNRTVLLVTKNFTGGDFPKYVINKLYDPKSLAEICERSKNKAYITYYNILVYQVNRLLMEDACNFIDSLSVDGCYYREEKINYLGNLFYGLKAFARDKGIIMLANKPREYLEIRTLENLLGIDMFISKNHRYEPYDFYYSSYDLVEDINHRLHKLFKAFINKCCESQNEKTALKIAEDAIFGQGDNETNKPVSAYRKVFETISGLELIVNVNILKKKCYWYRSLENALEKGIVKNEIVSALRKGDANA